MSRRRLRTPLLVSSSPFPSSSLLSSVTLKTLNSLRKKSKMIKMTFWIVLNFGESPTWAVDPAVLSEVATGKRGGQVVALVDVRRAHFYAPARRRVFVELPPEDYQASDDHMCGLLQYSLYGPRRCTKLGGKNLHRLSDLKLTRGMASPCVWQCCIKGEHVEATVDGDDITIGGKRSGVELLIKMISRK